jgi:aromatic-amino-acid transaminase
MTSIVAPAPSSLFAGLTRQPPDALLAVIGMHRADPRSHKIDVGVGMYRDESGATPVMRAVKAAEERLLKHQHSKGYLGAEGDQRYTDLLARLALGTKLAESDRLTGVQTPGGTGALRLAAELTARSGRAPTVWIGTPTWPNHVPIFRAAGLAVETHAYFDADRSGVDMDGCLAALSRARAGDIVVLHGCCHNPTGARLTAEQWTALADLIAARGLVPMIDLAYQGLGQGLDADAAGTRLLLNAVPEAMVAYSCDKNFALYRERVGALWIQAATPSAVMPVRDALLMLARWIWSMPPDHGAAVVRTILEDDDLSERWLTELSDMRARIAAIRASLGEAHPVLAHIAQQEGLFALLPIDSTAVASLRDRQAIYMPDSGRINVAGLNSVSVKRFAEAVMPYLQPRCSNR